MNERSYLSIYFDELYHYGIPDQKWGVRRFQNPDGSLTPAGRERYYPNSKTDNFSKLKTKIDRMRKSLKKHTGLYKKHVKNNVKRKHPWMMSDEELNSMINRLQAEKKLRDLVKDETSSKRINQILKELGDVEMNNMREFGRSFSNKSGSLIAERLFKKNDGGGKKNNNNNKKKGGNGGGQQQPQQSQQPQQQVKQKKKKKRNRKNEENSN